MRKLYNIQFFAEDVAENEPTEEVENPTVDESEQETEEKDVNFTDGEQEEEPREDIKKKNSEAAKRRIAERQKRQEEERRKALEIEKRKSYVEGVKKSTNGINKFTEQPIEDDDDVEEYEIMLRLEKEGKDPIEDYHKAVKEMRKAERQKALDEEKERQKADEDMNREVDEFVAKYGAETAQSISKDTDFMEFANDLIGKVPLNNIYEKYLKIQAKIEAFSDKKAIEKDARRMSSSGGLGKAQEQKKTFADMSKDEFAEFQRKILNKI